MGAYVGRGIRAQALDCPVGAGGGAARRRARAGPGGFTYGDFGTIWSATPRSTPTARSGRRRCGICAARARLGRGRARRDHRGACGSRRPSPPSWTRATRSCSGPADAGAARRRCGPCSPRAAWASTRRRPAPRTCAPIEDSRGRRTAADRSGRSTAFVADAETGVGIAGATVERRRLARPAARDRARAAATRSTTCRGAPIRASIFTRRGYDRIDQAGHGRRDAHRRSSAELRRNWASASGGATSLGGEALKDQGCGSLGGDRSEVPGPAWSTTVPTTRTMVVTLPQTVDVRALRRRSR